jgi:hypothetical protein
METQYTWRTRQDLDICQDCVHVSANGSPTSWATGSPDYDGYIESGHAERYAQAVKQYGDEPCYLGTEPSFVRVPCDFCGDAFAGARYSASVMQLHTEER